MTSNHPENHKNILLICDDAKRLSPYQVAIKLTFNTRPHKVTACTSLAEAKAIADSKLKFDLVLADISRAQDLPATMEVFRDIRQHSRGPFIAQANAYPAYPNDVKLKFLAHNYGIVMLVPKQDVSVLSKRFVKITYHVPKPKIKKIPPPPRVKQPKPEPKNILLVVENPYYAKSMHSLLEGWGHNVLTCTNAESALNALDGVSIAHDVKTGFSAKLQNDKLFDAVVVDLTKTPESQITHVYGALTAPARSSQTPDANGDEPVDIQPSIDFLNAMRLKHPSTTTIIAGNVYQRDEDYNTQKSLIHGAQAFVNTGGADSQLVDTIEELCQVKSRAASA